MGSGGGGRVGSPVEWLRKSKECGMKGRMEFCSDMMEWKINGVMSRSG